MRGMLSKGPWRLIRAREEVSAKNRGFPSDELLYEIAMHGDTMSTRSRLGDSDRNLTRWKLAHLHVVEAMTQLRLIEMSVARKHGSKCVDLSNASRSKSSPPIMCAMTRQAHTIG